jgi:putative addiction module killer protein
MASFTVEYYVTPNGKVPFREWQEHLKDKVAKAAIIRRVIRIQLGNFGDHKQVGDGVSELRIDVGPGYRVYYAVSGKAVIVILTAGDKRSQMRDIAQAKRYWQEYLHHGKD